MEQTERKPRTLKKKLNDLNRKHRTLKRRAAYLKWEGTPTMGSTIHSFFDCDNIKGSGGHREAESILTELAEVLNQIVIVEGEIQQAEQEIEQATESAKESWLSTEDKIFYLQTVVGFTLNEIADTLGYSHDYVRHIAG